MVLSQAHQDGIVDDAAVRGGDQHVLALANRTLGEVAGRQHVREPEGVGSRDLDLSLHGHVPQRDVFEEVPVLGLQVVVADGEQRVVVDRVGLRTVALLSLVEG